MAITDKHKKYIEFFDDWTADKDFFDGDTAVKLKKEVYLPKLTTDQEDDAYLSYLRRGLYPGFVGRTVEGLTGSALLKTPEIDLPAGGMENLIKEQDVKVSVKEDLTYGRLGLLVDMEKAEDDPQAAQNVFIRPYNVFEIPNWELDKNGKYIRIVLIEYRPGEDEEGNKIEILTYRELILDFVYQVKIWVPNVDGEYVQEGSTIFPQTKGTLLDFIPFIFINPIDLSATVEVSPVQDMVATARSHYQLFADYKHGLHYTALPTFTATGIDPEKAFKVQLGSGIGLASPNTEAKFGMLEFTGQGLGAVVTALTEHKDLMAFQGARLLVDPKKGVESSETHRLKQGAENATLSSIVDTVEAAYRLAIDYANIFLSTSVDSKTAFSMSRDFIDSKMTPEQMKAQVESWMSKAISYETMYHNLKEGEMTRPGVSAEQEKAGIEEEMPGMNTNENP